MPIFSKKSLFLNRQGTVLVITLVLLTSISFLASFLYFRTVENRKVFSNLQIRQTVEEFLPLFADDLLQLMGEYQKKYGSLPRKVSFVYRAGKTLGAGEVEMYLSTESERLNLNKASSEELLELFSSLGITEEKALVLRDSLLDWRDEDDDPRPFGAEKDWYKDYSPGNTSLKNFSELLLIRGFDPYLLWFKPGLFDKITIYDETITDKENKSSPEKESFSFIPGKHYRLDLKVKIIPHGPFLRYTAVFRWGKPPKILFEILR